MLKYILKRIVSILITLWIVCTLTFFMMKAIPGGPFTGEKNLPPTVLEALNEKYHLNDPILKQYTDYMKGVFTFNIGPSFKKVGVNVEDLMMSGFPISAKLGGITILIILLIGVPTGIIAALKRGRYPDYIVTILATVGIAVPTFVMGSVMLYVFGAKLGWIPTYGFGTWKHYIGPSIALAAFSMAFVMRLTRSSMIDVMSQDYIRTAKAKGLSQRTVIFKHAFKNAVIPVVTYVGPMTAGIMSGSFVIEKIFAIPGMGKFFVEAINNRDYTVIMGTTFFYAALAATMILVVDILYAVLDPRIKYK